MACDSQVMIVQMIESDKHFIRNCWYIYSVIFAASIVSMVFLHLQDTDFTHTASGMLINGMAIPLMLKHLQRIAAIDMLKGLYKDCSGHDSNDPICKRIADNVDSLLRMRGGI